MVRLSRSLLVLSLLVVFAVVAGCAAPLATQTIPATPKTRPTETSAPTPGQAPVIVPPTTPKASTQANITPQGRNGSLETVKGVRVLRLWGNHQQMGYAYGRLLAKELTDMIQNRLFAHHFEKTLANMTYEKMVERMNRLILWPEGYLDEIRAMVRGMQDALGGSLPTVNHRSIQGGPKKIDADMLALWFSLPDLLNVSTGCDSFVVWGDMSSDGYTRIGANHEQVESGSAQGQAQLIYIVVRSPDDGMRTVSVGSAVTNFGVWRGVNETGVGMAIQGMLTPWVRTDRQRYPMGLLRRYALEKISAGTSMAADMLRLFESHPIGESQNVVFAQPIPAPDASTDQIAVVIETDTNGATARYPSQNRLYNTPLDSAIVTANHYLSRERPTSYKPEAWWLAQQQNSLNRYNRTVDALRKNKISGLPDMQQVLQAAAYEVYTSYSAYLELNSRTISVAIAQPNTLAPYVTPGSFTWDELFAPIPK